MDDAVLSPAHYNAGGVETIDYIKAKMPIANFVGYCAGNVLKYASRSGLKHDTAEDYAKAAFYAQMAAHVLAPTRFPDPRHAPQD
jgi:hypothetical protein